jgi:DNA-binding NtrC family response regulator
MPDSAATMMLISGDSCLIKSCQGVVDSLSSLRLIVMEQARDADSHLAREDLRLIAVHLRRESDSGEVVRLLHRLAALERAVALLVIAEEHDPAQAWGLMRLGATDYLRRRLDGERLSSLIRLLTAQPSTADREPPLSEPIESALSQQPPSLRVACRGIDAMMEQVRRVALQDTTILLGGETGTGKTRLARLIHDLSPRSAEPFLAINCGALAAELIESEMFGHVKGAFTGADRARVGKFAAAGRGTLLLDEIDALPLALQAKLLRAVEERLFEPVGCNDSQPVQARLIAASNRSPEREVEAGRFRADLYYRLNVVSFHLPPLREQPELVATLANHFLKECAARNSRPVQGIGIEALSILEAYRWPGNIRELRNVMERAVALCSEDYIGIGDLPEALCSAALCTPARSCLPLPSEGRSSRSALRRAKGKAEAALIVEALRKHGNNRLRAALELGISRRTLYKKLHRYGLMESDGGPSDGPSAVPSLPQTIDLPSWPRFSGLSRAYSSPTGS